MAQDYYAFDANDIVKNAMPLLYKYISSIASVFSGTAFPTQGLTQGMLCYRTDQEKLYQLKALPSTWVLIADLKRDITHASTADRATNATAANNADTVDGKHATDGAGQIALKDGSNDLNCRLVRQSYQDQGNISGGLVFRINNSSDNYLRVCNNVAAIRNFLGLGNVNNTADSQKSVSYANSAGNAKTVGGYSVGNAANQVPLYNASGHLVLPSGAEIW